MGKFSVELREFRKSKGWSKKFLTDKLNVPYQTWCNWESDTNEPPFYVMELLMEKLKRMAKGEM